MNIELNKFQKGILLLSAGLVLLLYSTGLLTTGIETIFVITSLLMLTCGFYLVDGPQVVRNLFVQLSRQAETNNKKKSDSNNNTPKQQSDATPEEQKRSDRKKSNSQK